MTVCSDYRPGPFLLRPAAPGPALGIIMKNPSKPDTLLNQTFRQVNRYAETRGFGEVLVANLFSRRSSSPAGLNPLSYAEAVGAGNDEAIAELATRSDVVVAAWGGPNGVNPHRYLRRVGQVLGLLRGVELWTIGELTTGGHPRHPAAPSWGPHFDLLRYRPARERGLPQVSLVWT